MKAVLICPGERPAVSALAQSAPLALAPILGKTLLDYWLDHLVDRGVRHVYLLVSDRPDQVRAWLGDGVRWELKVEVVTEDAELKPVEARAKYRSAAAADWPAEPTQDLFHAVSAKLKRDARAIAADILDTISDT